MSHCSSKTIAKSSLVNILERSVLNDQGGKVNVYLEKISSFVCGCKKGRGLLLLPRARLLDRSLLSRHCSDEQLERSTRLGTSFQQRIH